MYRRFLIVMIAALLSVVVAGASELEQPPSYDVNQILGSAANGPGYRLGNPVHSDGYLRNYTIETSYGTFLAAGDQMLLMRIKELEALEALDKTANSSEFTGAMVKAGLSPVQFAGKLVDNPVGTVQNTLTGVGQLFSGFAAGVANAGKTQDNVVASITGEAQQKRLIAYQYGVDPYTDFAPLAKKLDAMATSAAAGKLVVSAAFMAIPGAAGTIVSNVSTANNINSMVRDYSAAQLMQMNEQKLGQLGIERGLIDHLLQNRNYTPVDTTVMTDALTRMGNVGNLNEMVAHAAAARSRDTAYFIRKRFEMLSAYQARHGDLQAFIRAGHARFPLAQTTEGGVAAIFPIDILSWTAETSRVIEGVSKAVEGSGLTGPRVLYITGSATRLAKQELKRLGWKLEENAPL